MLWPVGAVEDAQEALSKADAARAAFDIDGAVAHPSAAIRGFTAAGEPRQAAMVCVQLGDMLENALGNLTAARAWYTRARRLVDGEPPCIEQGWVAVAAMGCDVDDPAALLAGAELALDRARRFGDLNLETKALADAALAHVQAGRVDEGMALLDEAMALACGPADDRGVTAKSVCSFFSACYFAADFERAGSWADLLRQHGLIGNEPGGPSFLSSHCDSVQATLLMELGRWGDAEAVLLRSIADFEAAMGMPAWHPAIALADLRIRQGRHAEAEALLIGRDHYLQALLPLAHLHLERGDHALAAAAARRGLRVLGDDRLRAVELLTVLLDAELATGDTDAAMTTCEALRERARDLDVTALRARATAARSRLLAATGQPDAAIATLERTIESLDARHLPWLRATLRIELAALLEREDHLADAQMAAAEARAALADLDVVLSPDARVVLERLAPTSSPVAPARTAGATATLSRDGAWWTAAHAGMTVRLRHSKGLAYLGELLLSPSIERHALDLADRIEGVGLAGEPDRRALGHAGETLDSHARSAYRHRIEALRADIDDALDDGPGDAEARALDLGRMLGEEPIEDLLEHEGETAFDTASLPTPTNRRRMEWLFERREFDLPNYMRPDCHSNGHSYPSMYGRLRWESPAQTITSGFGSMGQGRYVHPLRPRTLTPHEAARIQFLPDFLRLNEIPTRTALARAIGNAAPPRLTITLVEALLAQRLL